MAATLANVPVTGDDWISVNATLTIAIGQAIRLSNNTFEVISDRPSHFYIAESATKPTIDAPEAFGKLISDVRSPAHTVEIETGSLEIWLRCVRREGVATATVEVI